MREEIVTVVTPAGTFTGFERVTVTAKFSDACRAFHLHIAAENGPYASRAAFAAGVPISILLSGSPVLTGYVDRYQPRLAQHSRASIDVAGRSRAQDFVDSSALHATGEFKNKTPAEIGRELDRFGVGVATDQALERVALYRLTPGESPFRAVEKLCRAQGVWCSGQPDGSILITVAGRARNAPIIEGVNLLEGRADHNWANRHSDVIVRGQRPHGHSQENLEIEAKAKDAALGRYRPVCVIEDCDTSPARARKRAAHRRDSEAGNALKASVTVQGFHDEAGALWQPGSLTFLESPFLAIAQDMAIEQAEYSQDRHAGTLTKLSLVDPRALGGKNARKGGARGAAWNSAAGDE
jgi:prophage tail gpP-like protein